MYNNKNKNNPVKIRGLSVEVKYDNVEKALKKLRKAVDDDGRLRTVKEKEHYEKPSVKKRLQKKKAIQKRLKEENKQKKLFETGKLN